MTKANFSNETSQFSFSPDELMERTRQIEFEKAQKQAARARRAAEKAAAKRRKHIERWIAPMILILTVLLGIFVQLLYR